MIAQIVASIMTGKLLKEKNKEKKNRVFKKLQKKQNPTGVDAAPTRNFPEVLADIEKKSLDF